MAILSQIALFPIAADKHVIPSLRVNAQIEVKKKNEERSLFDPFFDSFFSKVNKVLVSKKIYFKVNKFPRPIPEKYSGAVGSFQLKPK